MRTVYLSFLTLLLLGLLAQAILAEGPCCSAVNFQSFDVKQVTIQLVEVKRTSPNDITVTWQILNHTQMPVQFDRMNGLASYQLSSASRGGSLGNWVMGSFDN